jgi:type IV secretory pathway ATPase VirB11/archaellum biosynthesis ATPase
METEILASKDKCFTGRLSRLVSCLDGFHPGVRVKIATSDQISNRVLITIKKCKDDNLSNEETIKRITQELKDLELDETQINEWIDNVKDTLSD